jgi:2-C-methyl-D-erythritol 4-phosphate cytidylyltransferase
MGCLAILVAAGRGERMGAAAPKAFLPVAGEPMVLRAARALEAAPSVEALVVVVPEPERERARALLAPLRKLRDVVAGGTRRQDSVLEGLKRTPDGFAGVVLVHDAARPFVEESLVEEVVRVAAETGAAIPVSGLVDTIKRVEHGRVVATVSREDLGAAQTPQGFRFDLLVRAYESAFRDRVTLTDEAMALERLGIPVAAVPGPPRNRKITTPEDLLWAEDLLRREAAGP